MVKALAIVLVAVALYGEGFATPPCGVCNNRVVVNHQKAVAVKAVHYNQVPIVHAQPLWQVGYGLQQESQAEYQFRLSPSQQRLNRLEGYYEAMETAKAMMTAQQPAGSPQQSSAIDRYPTFVANCATCHSSGTGEGGLLFDPATGPTADEIKAMLDRVYVGEMPPDKCLTPAEYVALETELAGPTDDAPTPQGESPSVRWGATGPEPKPAATAPVEPAPATPPATSPVPSQQGSTKPNGWRVELAISRPS